MSSERALTRRHGAGAREVSAGGVVVRDGEVLVIVPTRRAPDGSRVLALPKGHPDRGESALAAAEREVREETGAQELKPLGELGEARYWYRRDGQTIGKSVTFFLFSSPRRELREHDNEVEEVRWMSLHQAREQLTHAAEREMIGRALARLDEGRKDR
jgi:8-oxo-dGTP pyrophosphatase MutT (NUDIX family)